VREKLGAARLLYFAGAAAGSSEVQARSQQVEIPHPKASKQQAPDTIERKANWRRVAPAIFGEQMRAWPNPGRKPDGVDVGRVGGA